MIQKGDTGLEKEEKIKILSTNGGAGLNRP